MEIQETIVSALLIIAGGSHALFSYMSSSRGSPVPAIFARWSRWIFMSLLIATLLTFAGVEAYPFWLLAVTSFLGWFLLETIYNWIAIDALSRSQFPLFPRFVENVRGDEWPNQKRLIAVKDWLRTQGFRRQTALVAEMGQDVILRTSVYQSADNHVRVQILFIPQRNDTYSVAYVVSSVTEAGNRVITDNFFLPFGGFYPEDWHLERKPWTRCLSSLLRRHRERIEAHGEALAEWETSPSDDINYQQRLLERVNTDLGFLIAQPHTEEHGRITPQGRYRVWLELWSLAYLGRPRDY